MGILGTSVPHAAEAEEVPGLGGCRVSREEEIGVKEIGARENGYGGKRS